MIRNIMGALADNSNSVVGVYGMGGIGKSTLLEDVERKIREEESFDWVAKADVSENPDIKTIQGEIADALGLTDIKNKEIISGRAKLLHGRLKDEEREKKKVLIILDNLWEGLELKKVGIPCGYDNKVMGCKLLLTSRHRDVLRRDMGCDKDFSLGGLKDEEAKRLFEKTVGDKVHDDELKSWVNVALDKCAGVPFLIDAMAKRFKDAELYEWRNTLKNFEEFKDKETKYLINHMLQWSYDKLEEDVKSLLRLCVVYSISKPSLENLVRYGFGLGLFGEVSSMEEARDRLRLQIRTLQASSLLLDSEDVDGFKIHDLVCEFVTLVVSRDHPLLVLKDKDKSILELLKDKLNSCRAVCFPYVDMEELPQELDCPELQIFLFFTNKKSLKVPYSLFHSMRKLMVLNLTRIRLTCSPSSPFQFLENLHTLCLDSCSLDNVAILGELKRLQILSFVNSNIHRLPKEIGQLVELRLLELNHCPQLEIIEPGILQSLIKLEELYMKGSFNQWNTMDQTPPTNASLIELNHMKNLRTLHVSIPNSSVLPEDLNIEKLTKYEIKIGNVWGWLSKLKGLRTLEIKSDPLGNILQKGCIQSILGKTDNLLLEQLDASEQSICMLSQKGFPELKHLQVENSPFIHYILQSLSHIHFKMLESLILKNLINLEMICGSHISSKSFSTLKVVKVKSCDKMEVLFPLSVMRGLPRLEEIQVVSCKLMRTIIEADDCHKFELCNLHVLKLHDLPNIKNFFNVGSTLLSSTSYDQVSTQIAFFNGQHVAFPSLEALNIASLDNIEMIWDNQVAADSFHNLKSLYVDGCNKLVNLVPSCILGRLLSLEILMARRCGSLEVVCELQPLNLLDGHPIALPLKKLTVSELPKLKCVWDKKLHHQLKFQCLRSISISRCKSLSSLFPTSIAKDLMQLEVLKIDQCGIAKSSKRKMD
ncbi:disease resistance protein At4g27190-like [Eucalyptus grandis]|uniref:disease resistance protein At4g27190-like n=1 Tax=Eucalyptus grandis TaxID=71139 RepID=UPI00192EF119|nr:disease resistance protein At4g27190-like [Eucalyptus grandis]